MSVNAKMKKICDNIRLRTGDTALLNLDQIAEAIMQIGEATDPAALVYRTIGATYPPTQLPAAPEFTGYDIDILNAMADDVYAYIDSVVSGKGTVTKEIMGKDESNAYNVARYIYANRERYSWVRENYPKMYAWKNSNTIKYTESVSPRIDEKAYDTPYVATKTEQTVIIPAKAVIYTGKRYSQSGAAWKDASAVASVILPIPAGSNSVTVKFTGMTRSDYSGVYGGATNDNFTLTVDNSSAGPWHTDLKGFDIPTGGATLNGVNFIVFFTTYTTGQTYDGATITINGKNVEWVLGNPSDARQESTTTTEVEGESGTPITAVSATRCSRTIGGAEYVRHEIGDVEPTVIYTDKSDSRNSGTSITQDGITYRRYPLGDLGANRKKLIPIFIYANEHGIVADPSATNNYETKMCALVAARFLRDLANGSQLENPLYKFIRENCMVIVIPVANPFGFNLNVTGGSGINTDNGYLNANRCNINRNYDTPGWDVMLANGETSAIMGTYPGSQNETQYIMNTMVESGAVVAMSLHGLGGWEGYCAHQGQNPGGVDYDRVKLAKVDAFLYSNYGYRLRYYELTSSGEPLPCQNTPDITSKSPSYITQCGAYGGIVEFSPDDVTVNGFSHEMKQSVIENAYAQTLNLTAMWLSDYLEA